MLDSGWVKLYRKLEQNPVWTQLSPAVLKVMIAMLLRANLEASTYYDGCVLHPLPPGALVTSYEKMGEFTHLSTQQVRDAFKHLENLEFSTYTRTPRSTIVVIRNWGTYQPQKSDENRVETTQGTGKEHPENTQRTPKEQRNKNIRSEEGRSEEVKPEPSPADAGSDTLFPCDPLVTKKRCRKPKPTLGTEQQREWYRQYMARHPKPEIQTVKSEELFIDKVTIEETFQYVMGELEIACKRDTTYIEGPWKWLLGCLKRKELGIKRGALVPVVQISGSGRTNREDERRRLFEERMRRDFANGKIQR